MCGCVFCSAAVLCSCAGTLCCGLVCWCVFCSAAVLCFCASTLCCGLVCCVFCSAAVLCSCAGTRGCVARVFGVLLACLPVDCTVQLWPRLAHETGACLSPGPLPCVGVHCKVSLVYSCGGNGAGLFRRVEPAGLLHSLVGPLRERGRVAGWRNLCNMPLPKQKNSGCLEFSQALWVAARHLTHLAAQVDKPAKISKHHPVPAAGGRHVEKFTVRRVLGFF